jgi:hypothetical protein
MADYELVDPQGNATTYNASFLRIATHLLADWRPWRPAYFATGLLGFLHGNAVHQSGRWVASQEGAHFEREWKKLASWAFGTAFCRDALDRMGYGAAVPVSVLTGSKPLSAQPGSLWSSIVSALPAQLHVDRPPPKTGDMPDLLTIHRASSALAFAEAKGTKHLLSGSVVAKKLTSTWFPQVANAEVSVGGQPVSADRLVTVTRLNPFAKGQPTREVRVQVFVPPSATVVTSSRPAGSAPDEGSQTEAEAPPSTPRPSVDAALELLNLAGLLDATGLPNAAHLLTEAAAAWMSGEERWAREQLLVRVIRGGREAQIPLAQREVASVRERERGAPMDGLEEPVFALGRFASGLVPTVAVGLDALALEQVDLAIKMAAQDTGAYERFASLSSNERVRRRTGVPEGGDVYLRSDGVAGWIDDRDAGLDG